MSANFQKFNLRRKKSKILRVWTLQLRRSSRFTSRGSKLKITSNLMLTGKSFALKISISSSRSLNLTRIQISMLPSLLQSMTIMSS